MQRPKKVTSNPFLIGRFEDENLQKTNAEKVCNDWCELDFVKFYADTDTEVLV
jgi:hypothetical protein